MTPEFVEFRGRRVIAGWPEELASSQGVATYGIGGVEYPRVRYGSETEDWGADRGPCHDCAAVKGEFHVLGCDAEECPVCQGSIFSCDCEKDFEQDEVE